MRLKALFLLFFCLLAGTVRCRVAEEDPSWTGRREKEDGKDHRRTAFPEVFRFRRTERHRGRTTTLREPERIPSSFVRTKRQTGETSRSEEKGREEKEEAIFKDREDYDSFFRNEYYRILAQSFASSRRKREAELLSSGQDLDDDYSSEQRNRKLLKKSITAHINSDDNDDLWNEYNDEETRFVQPQNAGFRPLPGFSARPVSNSDLPFGKWKFFNEEKYDQECPPLYLIAKECAALGGIMPEGNLKNILLRACNWLEICYSCGKNNGLQLDDCDTGFLYGIRSVCEGDVPCQATGRLLLLSLRQTGISQRSLTSVCNADRCIEQFLLQPSP
ncbi:uncharacterized protein [Centruroides vittatus]|uniref:uncharacterized protein n=1 Tax=Centruroides vittatus TaxID=120091 RepID=UPI00350F6451